MTMAIRVIIVALAGLCAAFPAKAATTLFAQSVVSQTGPVTNANAALFSTNGVGAAIGAGGELVLNYRFALTGAGVTTTFLPSGSFNALAVSLGEVVGGVALFSSEFLFLDNGTGGTQMADFSAACSAVSPSGCSLLRIRNLATLIGSSGAILDSVSGVSNAPEPSVWALMILGFAGLAARMKASRPRILDAARRPSGLLPSVRMGGAFA